MWLCNAQKTGSFYDAEPVSGINTKRAGGIIMAHDVVKIFTAQDNFQADMVLAALQDNGIPAYKQELGNTGFVTVYFGYGLGWADIYVADVNEEKAREILEDMGL